MPLSLLVKHQLLAEGPHPQRLAAGDFHGLQPVERDRLQDAHILSVPVRIAALQLLPDAPQGLRQIPVFERCSVS